MSPSSSSSPSLTRRDFLKAAAVTGTSLIIGFTLPGCGGEPKPAPTNIPAPTDRAVVDELPTTIPIATEPIHPNAYLQIDPDGMITIIIPRSEMGQGTQTSLAMILADELEADWSKVRMIQSPPDSIYGDQVTGGSLSIQDSWGPMRSAGAMARTLLIDAAAMIWGVDPSECVARLGKVIHSASGRELEYSQLVSVASQLKKPKTKVNVKDPKDYHLIGTPMPQIENPNYVSGKTQFCSDLRLPGMVYAAVVRCPVFGGKVASFDASRAKAVPGVKDVIQISNGVAVLADSTWAVTQARQVLQVTWDEGENGALSSAGIQAMAEAALKDRISSAKANLGEGIAKTIEAVYIAPFMAHATMEPMTCVADVRADSCEVWVPTQSRQDALNEATSASGLSRSQITIHSTLVGSAFGRRLKVDYVREAVEISKIAKVPVKLYWTRQDDIQHDFYRPFSYHWLQAGIDSQNNPVSWTHLIASKNIGSGDISQGAINLAYKLKKQVSAVPVGYPIPVGYWRSVFNTNNAFANECFFDELAEACGKDPVELRLSLLRDNDPMKKVIQVAAEKSGWGKTLPDGIRRGFACHPTWSASYVAQVAEVEVNNRQVRVRRVVCVVDCGIPVNPDMIIAQMEGGIVFGLSNALKSLVTIEKGQVQQSNFHDYPVLALDEMPQVEVTIIDTQRDPHGVGEMSNPVTVPAVLNAIYQITGKRIRTTPVRADDL